MTTALHIDFETRGVLDLRQVGLHRYARHKDTDVWCMAWALDDAEPSVFGKTSWQREDNQEQFYEATQHVRAGLPVYAHNAPFELEIWNQIMVPRYGWPVLKPEQTFCTMAMCYAMSLPGALEDAALALGLHVLKDAEGRSLMLRMARPRSTSKCLECDDGVAPKGRKYGTHWYCEKCKGSGTKAMWWDEPDKLARLYAYCQQDVRVERELHKRLMPLSDKERKVWLLDYRINQRGVQVDIPSAKAAVALTETMKVRDVEQISALTGGAVQAATALPALKEWMAKHGVKVDSLAKQAVVDLLAGDTLTPRVAKVLKLRQDGAKASTAKFDVMVNRAGEDGRLRQMYQYHGAGTGRWAGRGVQPANLPRDMPKAETVEKILALIRAGEHDAIDMLYGHPLVMASKCLRSFFVAPPGKTLISGDWSNVESRGAAWFAGEQWKLDAFRQQDSKTGPEVYCLGASKLLGVPVDQITKEQRQSHGKVPDLAFQYQGGVGSGHTMGKTYGVKATDQEWAARRDAWRAAHPAITKVWPAIQRAAINAVRNPGQAYECGYPGRQAKYKVVGSFLWCLLPSGRVICFPYPKLLEGEYGPQLTYMTVPDPSKPEKIIDDPKNASNWARVGTYGGALFNRIIQGFCRDFLVDAMLVLDADGAALVLHTYDSLSIEVDVSKADAARPAMEKIMLSPDTWAAGFPLYTECNIEARFRG